MLVGVLYASPASAQSATWLASPTVTNPADANFDFNANANWTPATAPGSMTFTGTATFSGSAGTNISFSAPSTTLGGFTLTAGASNYAFFNAGGNLLTFNGTGIVVNGGSATITNNSGSNIEFINNSTAGTANVVNNGGNTTFAGSSTASNATFTNNGGSTNFFATSTAASATITNNNNGLTLFGLPLGTDTSTAGSSKITNNGGGTTEFLASTTAGSAIITNNGGFISFFNTSTAGSATIKNNTGITEFFNSSTAGNATITNNNSAFTQFNEASTAGSAAITNRGGNTQFFNTSSASSATITNSGGNSDFFNTSTAASATITNNNGGATVFFDTSTAGGATITNNSGGSTTFAGTSTAGNATITNNGGLVTFFGNSDGGAAHLINGASGTVDFSGSAGLLGNGMLNVGSLQGNGTFIVGAQQIVAVTGSLAFTSGALYQVQVRGTNAGKIAVGGIATLAGTTVVDPLNRITKTTTYTILSSANPLSGTFGSVIVTNNFATNPMLSYVGNDVLLTLQQGLLSPALPDNANANQVKVAGAIDNALLGGNNLPGGFNALFSLTGTNLQNALTQISGETAVGSQQTTFNAMGQFMGVMTDPFMNRGGGFGGGSLSSGYAVEDADANAYAASNPPKTDAFAMFAKAPSQPSPASGGGIGWGFEQRWSVWAAGFGGSQSTNGNAAVGSNNTTSNIAGTAVGADYLISPTTIAGFALAGGGTNFSVVNGGTGRSDLFQIGAYVRHNSGPAYISAALAYGWQDVTTNRTVTVAGFDQLRAQFNANAWSGRVEGGYRFVEPVFGGVGITPYGAAQIVTFDLPAYAEQAIVGSNNFALSTNAKDVTDARTELGVRTDKSWAMGNGILTLRGRFAWAHDFNPDRSIAATFQTLPGASFVVNGAALAADSALTTASVEMKWRNGWSAAATFEGEFSNVTASYAGKGVVRYAW